MPILINSNAILKKRSSDGKPFSASHSHYYSDQPVPQMCSVTAARVWLDQVITRVNLIACARQTGKVWFCPQHPFRAVRLPTWPQLWWLDVSTPRQFTSPFWQKICPAIEESFVWVRELNPSVNLFMLTSARGLCDQERGDEGGEGSKTSSSSVIVRVRCTDLAACETEAVIKSIHISRQLTQQLDDF